MEKNLLEKSKPKINNKVAIIITCLVFGLTILIITLSAQINWFPNTGNTPTPSVKTAETDLNSSNDNLLTINPDKTMGPVSASNNWSNSLPAGQKGNLEFALTDPPGGNGTGNKPENTGKDNSNKPSNLQPTQAKGGKPTSQASKNGPQTVTSLVLNISKVEVHFANTITPSGEADETATPEETSEPEKTAEPNETAEPSETAEPTETSEPTEKPENTETPEPSETPKATGILGANLETKGHWETLDITPGKVDLMVLAQTGDLQMLGITNLAAGRYTEIRLYVSSATATLEDGTTVNLELPGNSGIVRVVHTFTIESGQTTRLTLDINAQKSVIKSGESYRLKPVVAKILVE